MKIWISAGFSLLVVAVVLSGCGKPEEASTPEAPASTTNSQGEATVELTATQLKAVKVQAIISHFFPVEKEMVGSVSFDEDPAIVQAQATLVGAAATFNAATKQLERAKALGETNGIAPKELEQDVAAVQTDDAALKAARDAVRAMGITDEQIEKMIAEGRIVSPSADSSGQAQTNKWVTANPIESDSPQFHSGQPVKARVMAFPAEVFRGRISRIYATVDPNLHRLMMRCAVEDPRDELRPGMLANVSIEVKEPIESTAIPMAGVVREDDGRMTAWVTTDSKRFAQRTLKLGLENDGQYQVVEGLHPGEMAVTEGAVFLSNLLNAPPSD